MHDVFKTEIIQVRKEEKKTLIKQDSFEMPKVLNLKEIAYNKMNKLKKKETKVLSSDSSFSSISEKLE